MINCVGQPLYVSSLVSRIYLPPHPAAQEGDRALSAIGIHIIKALEEET